MSVSGRLYWENQRLKLLKKTGRKLTLKDEPQTIDELIELTVRKSELKIQIEINIVGLSTAKIKMLGRNSKPQKCSPLDDPVTPFQGYPLTPKTKKVRADWILSKWSDSIADTLLYCVVVVNGLNVAVPI